MEIKARSIIKNNDTHKDSTFSSAGSTIDVQREDRGLWTHGVIIEATVMTIDGNPTKLRLESWQNYHLEH